MFRNKNELYEEMDIFICYELKKTYDICTSLDIYLYGDYGMKVWYNYNESKMFKGIDNCRNVLLFVTKSFFKNEICKNQLKKIVELNKNIIVVFELMEQRDGCSVENVIKIYKNLIPREIKSIIPSFDDWIPYERRSDYHKQTIDLIIQKLEN